MDSDSLNIYISKDKHGTVHSIDHLEYPYSPKGLTVEPNAVNLSQQYVRDTASLYGIPDSYLKQLDKQLEKDIPTLPSPTAAAEPALLLAGKPRCLHKTTVVSYQRTIYGLPVWQERISVSLNKDLGVISSCSTIRTDKDAKPLDQSAKFITTISDEAFKTLLGLVDSDLSPHINSQRLLEYKFDPKAREEEHDSANPKRPVPRLPPLPQGTFNDGTYYAVMEVLFTLGSINWRAFVEVETGAVLYLRCLVVHLHGFVYTADPPTRLGAAGPHPGAVLVDLNRAREWMELPGLIPSVPQQLNNEYIELDPVVAPAGANGHLSYNATTDEFAAVNAYYHLTSLFRLVQSLGFDIQGELFANTEFPVPVDHRGLDEVNAETWPNNDGNGVARFVFGVAANGAPISIACSFRVVAHEFCHALLLEAIKAGCFSFAHTAGDALGSIFCDPFTRLQGNERFNSFPWAAVSRRHDRAIAQGWAWGGANDTGHTAGHDGYQSEQILTTSLFRAYRCIGGDAQDIGRKQWASRYMLYLIIEGIASLPQDAPESPIPYVTALMHADDDQILGFPGGAVRKVIRWSFEEQGLYQPAGAAAPVVARGAPPPVDVFINDGRNGGYNFLADWNAAPGIWNRTANDGGQQHQNPVGQATNYCYVRIQNRGTQAANQVVVHAYHRAGHTDTTWPASFQATTTAPIHVAQNIAPGGNIVVGPFEWVPFHYSNTDSLLVAVSAGGDWSNIHPASLLPCAMGPIDLDKLVPFDNNIGLRVMNIQQA
ncbi:hypothetical protein V8C42DRAFT_338970 [Trichoderma barbatum]